MRTDYVKGKYELIITLVIHLCSIHKNVHVRNGIYWCYYGKSKTRYLNVIR